MTSKPLPVDVEQPRMMERLLLLHFIEHRSGCRVPLAQPVGELAINPAVFLFKRDGESEDLLLG